MKRQRRRQRLFMMLAMLLMTQTMPAQVNKYFENHIFVGTLNGKTPVEVAWQTNAEGRMAGYIYYPNASRPAPILIVGHHG